MTKHTSVTGLGGATTSVTTAVLPPSSIVAIGASAGGLEALEQFLSESGRLHGAAFIIVQHMPADQPSLLADLLQRAATLPVVTPESDQWVEADKVFVRPPGVEIRLSAGRFVLSPMGAALVDRLPIDTLFRSLATSSECPVVGVVLSGMGCDGTLGLLEIKRHGGATFAQAPESAQFDSMPLNALKAGAADASAAPYALPMLIDHHLTMLPGHAQRDSLSPHDLEALATIVETLRQRTGHDFGAYKKTTICRRVKRRAALHRRASFADYAALLATNQSEAELLFRELLIGVTAFFRDATVWEHLGKVVIPELLANRGAAHPLRVWVAGCSTGEEVYSLAIVLTEALLALDAGTRPDFKIFATDIDGDAIDRARIARYPASISSAVTAARLERFFTASENGYQVANHLREKIVFAIQNVAMDPPFTKLDLLVCRNLMIYFEPMLQQKLMALFHFSLEPGGLLLLGTAESVGAASDRFAPLPGRFKIYRRVESVGAAGFVAFRATFNRNIAVAGTQQAAASASGNVQHTADQFLLQRYSPAAVLVGTEGDVLYISGKTGRFLEPAAGRANWNIFAMARDGLLQPLGSAFRRAVREQTRIDVPRVVIETVSDVVSIRLSIEPLASRRPLEGMYIVVFTELERATSSAPADTGGTLAIDGKNSERELAVVRQALLSAREDSQSSDEQFRAVNEELQSANEELQSTNEELTTSKEEMQSMNEELQTVNRELRSKVEALSQESDDIRNLLDSTELATLFLDQELRIRRFTPAAVGVFKLIASDVGRPITDITNTLKSWDMARDAREVLASLVFRERETEAVDNRWFRTRVMAYRTATNRIQGVVITLSETTISKRLEKELLLAKSVLEEQLIRERKSGLPNLE